MKFCNKPIVKFTFVLDWTFSSGHWCMLRFGRDSNFFAAIDRWWELGFCTLSEARDAMDLVDAVLDSAVDVFAATGDR